jgi:hypothetical protein
VGYLSGGLDKPLSTVVVLSKDSALTYIEEVGYIKWKASYRINDHDTDIRKLTVTLTYDYGHGYLHITHRKIYHRAYFKVYEHEFIFVIRYERNNKIRPARSLYERHNFGKDPTGESGR